MPYPKIHKINAVADGATPIRRRDASDALIMGREETPQEAVLRAAADRLIETQKRGVLQPALRVMLDAMTQDYAKILTRIDRIAAEAEDDKSAKTSDKSEEC